MKALVTGANGFLGSWVVRGLLKRGYSVRVVHRKNSDVSALKGLDVESYVGDVTDFISLKDPMVGVDHVFHVAGLVSYKHTDRDKMEAINVAGTANVLKAAQIARVKRLVLTSSVVTVGASREPQVLNEESAYTLGIYNFGYYETKRKAEEIILKAARGGGIDAVVVNPSSMFGPGDAVKSSRQKYLRVAQGRFPYYPPGGVNILDVEDAVEGHLLAAERGRSGERYILGAENISVEKLFELFARAGGVEPPRKKVPAVALRSAYWAGRAAAALHLPVKFSYESAMIGSLYHWYDHSKATRELGFKPRPAAEAIRRSVDWSFEHGLLRR